MPRPVDPTIVARLRGVRGIMFDIDGCLVLSDGPSGHDGHALPGAVEVLAYARATGRSVCVFTNGTASPPAVIASHLRELDLDVRDEEVLTPAVVAADVIKRTYGNRPVLVFGGAGMLVEFARREVEVIDLQRALEGDFVQPAAVVIGWDTDFGARKLQLAAAAVRGGAAVYCTSDAPMYASRSRLNVGVSGFIAVGLRHVTGTGYEVLGKPSADAMVVIGRVLGVDAEHVLVVGDDIALEARMARTAGAVGALVLTGTTQLEDLRTADAGSQPDLVLDGLDDLVELLAAADAEGPRVGLPA